MNVNGTSKVDTLDTDRITLLLAQIAAHLEAIENHLLAQNQAQGLGFSEPPRPRYIYCDRSQNCLWYWLNDAREIMPIAQTSLTCCVEKLEFKQVERRDKETWKLHLHVRADRRYILEAGHDSNFSKSLLASLAVLSPDQLQHPITIEVQAAESDEVLFCRLYSNNTLVFAPWSDVPNWKTVAQQAIQVVNRA